MILKEHFEDLATSNGPMRTFLFQPAFNGTFPGVVLFSEIYQVTGPIERVARQIASHGYLVAVPEIFHEFEPLGSPFAYDTAGTNRGNSLKVEKELASYDEDARVVLDYLKNTPACSGQLGVMGICIGGHLSFRAAMNDSVAAGVCFYATDIHKRSLAKGLNDNTLDRISEIKSEMLMIWGKQDPHIPQAGRELIYRAMLEANVVFSWHEFNAEHAFIRDEGPRYNPTLSQIGLSMTLELFERKLRMCEPTGVSLSGDPNRSLC